MRPQLACDSFSQRPLTIRTLQPCPSGTRPDCLPPDVIDLLAELNQQKTVWVELGLQTIHDRTASLIRRGLSAVRV